MAASSPARKSAPRKAAPTPRAPRRRPAPVLVHPSAPSGRFAELLSEVHTPEPYEITQNLIVAPPTWRQQRDITACQGAFAVANSQLSEMMTPKPVRQLDDDGNVIMVPELDDEDKPIIDAEGNDRKVPLILMEIPEADPARIQRINEVVEASADRYNRALLGESYGAVMEFFEDRPAAEWNAFYKDIQDRFLPLPDDGLCPTCGHVDNEEQAGKPVASTA